MKRSAPLASCDDPSPVDVRGDLALHPAPVVEEAGERNGQGDPLADLGRVAVERQRAVVLGDAGGGPVGAEQHPGRHRAPERHRFAEYPCLDARPSQVGSRGEPVGACADDRDIRAGHFAPLCRGRPRSSTARSMTEM